MLQLAFAEEFAGQDEKATGWYTRITTEFPRLSAGGQGRGCHAAHEVRGTNARIRGQRHDGNPVSVAALRGKVVVIHYWATWCGPCKQDISVLKDMQTKYGKGKRRDPGSQRRQLP